MGGSPSLRFASKAAQASASVSRLQGRLPAGFRPRVLKFYGRVSLRRNGHTSFSLLKTSHHDLSSLKPKISLNSRLNTVSPSQLRPGLVKRCEQGQVGRFQFRLQVEIPRPGRGTKTQCGVRPTSIGRCGPRELRLRCWPARARTVTGGLTSPHAL
jgi:hypothetical protein